MTKTLLVALGGAFPIVFLIGVLIGTIGVDFAVAVIQAVLAGSPVLLIIDNYRKKVGQNALSMVVLASGLSSVGIMFLTVGLVLAGLAVLASGFAWSLLSVQSFLYGGAR